MSDAKNYVRGRDSVLRRWRFVRVLIRPSAFDPRESGRPDPKFVRFEEIEFFAANAPEAERVGRAEMDRRSQVLVEIASRAKPNRLAELIAFSGWTWADLCLDLDGPRHAEAPPAVGVASGEDCGALPEPRNNPEIDEWDPSPVINGTHVEDLMPIDDRDNRPENIYGSVELFGGTFHVEFIRVVDSDGEQVAVNDPAGRLDFLRQHDPGGVPFLTVRIPGVDGEFVPFLQPGSS